jgi:general secretion pathway protein J
MIPSQYAWRIQERSGFTLVEMAIALTLLSLILMILYGAFHLGQGAVEKTRLQAEATRRVRSVPQFLGSYVRSAYPYRLSPREASFFFSGEEKRLTFVSAFSRGMGGRGFSRVTLFWDEGAKGLLTLDEEIPVRLGGDGEGGGYKNSVVIGQGVRDFHLDYLGLEGGEERWVDRWEGAEQKTLPRAIRLRYRMDREKAVEWTFPVMIRVLAP